MTTIAARALLAAEQAARTDAYAAELAAKLARETEYRNAHDPSLRPAREAAAHALLDQLRAVVLGVNANNRITGTADDFAVRLWIGPGKTIDAFVRLRGDTIEVASTNATRATWSKVPIAFDGTAFRPTSEDDADALTAIVRLLLSLAR